MVLNINIYFDDQAMSSTTPNESLFYHDHQNLSGLVSKDQLIRVILQIDHAASQIVPLDHARSAIPSSICLLLPLHTALDHFALHLACRKSIFR